MTEREGGMNRGRNGNTSTALYRGVGYEAMVLFIGDLDLMQKKLEASRNAYQPRSDKADIPKGRGHCVVKKLNREDFVEHGLVAKDASTSQPKLPTKKSLKHKSKENTGDEIIKKVLVQSGADVNPVHDRDSGEETDNARQTTLPAKKSLKRKSRDDAGNEDPDNIPRPELPTKRQVFESMEDTDSTCSGSSFDILSDADSITDGAFVEAGLIATLRAEDVKLEKRIEELEEERHSMLPVLKELEVIKEMIAELQSTRRCNIIPPRSAVFQSPRPMQSPSPRPMQSSSSSPSSSTPVDNDAAASQKTFQINSSVVRRAGATPSLGSHVCNLMTSMYTRQEMAASSFRGKNGNKALSPEKVQAIIEATQDKYPNSSVSEVRCGISTKLRDERAAWEKKKEGERPKQEKKFHRSDINSEIPTIKKIRSSIIAALTLKSPQLGIKRNPV